MQLRIRSLALALLLSLLSPLAISAAEEAVVPAAPEYYVLDQPKLLSPGVVQALQRILVEHDHLTNEQLMLGIFKDPGKESKEAYTRRVFNGWNIGSRSKGSGVLIAVFQKGPEARIEVGYGLDPLLTDAETKRIVNEDILPEMRAGQADRAVSLAAMEALRVINSPLVQNGKAQQTLRAGGFQGDWVPVIETPGYGATFWSIWMVLGLTLAFFALRMLLSAEGHYTSEGWFRPAPHRHLKQKFEALFLRRSRGKLKFEGGGASGQW